MPSWDELQAAMASAARLQLFFVGGAPRSGTTWLQQLLDSHPEVCCRGEGLFQRQLATPLDKLVQEWRKTVAAKNARLFRHTSGYPEPGAETVDALIAAGVLVSLARQLAGRQVRALGEKTPENVFFFPVLKRIFPAAKFLGIVRDPRDVITSAWHFFGPRQPGQDRAAALRDYVGMAMPSLLAGLRSLSETLDQFPRDCMAVTYEAMHQDPAPPLARMFRLLGVSDDPATVAACLERNRFEVMTAGRKPGDAREGEFLRSGTIGTWRETLTPELNRQITDAFAPLMQRFGWTA